MTLMTRAALVLAGVLLLAACSGSSNQPEDRADGPATADATPTALAGVDPPAGFTEHTVGGVTFAAPEELEQVPLGAPAEGTEELGLRAPSAEGELAAAVLAQVVAQPPRDAATEADNLETVKREVQGAQEVGRRALDLEGFTTALVVSYQQPAPNGSLTRTDQLVADLADGGLLSLTVAAPLAAFESGDLEMVTRTATAR